MKKFDTADFDRLKSKYGADHDDYVASAMEALKGLSASDAEVVKMHFPDFWREPGAAHDVEEIAAARGRQKDEVEQVLDRFTRAQARSFWYRREARGIAPGGAPTTR